MKLIVGLGNPGKRYGNTRHNLGFLVVDRVAEENDVLVKRKLCGALVGEWTSRGKKLLLVKPQCFMNRSGDPVKELLQRYRATTDDLLVIYDDLDLPFGRIRIRSQGSAGGHRGVRSILEALAGAPFCRVRIGIGRPPAGIDPVDYVLQPFDPEERAILGAVTERGAEAVKTLVNEGTQTAMERFNRAS